MSEQVSMRRMMMVLLVAAALSLGACASKKPKFIPAPGPNAAEAGAQGSGANGANAGAGDEEAEGPQGGMLATRLVYFDFDSSEIKGQGTDVVGAHAKYLGSHGSARVRLEGHTDERGSREYNIGLGRAPRPGGTARAAAAGRVRGSDLHRQLWRGAPGRARS